MTSQINPNNINGAYPVAGQDNNSQGFRDNFTNTGTNFQYAAQEITDLQNKTILSSQLTGGAALTTQNNMQNSPLINALVSDFAFTTVGLGTLSGSVNINYAAGHFQSVQTGASLSLAFTNWPAAGQTGIVTVQVTVTDVAYTLTLPSAVTGSVTGIQGLSSNVITFAQTGTYVFQFTTADNGTTIYINDLSRPRNYFMNTVTIGANTASTSNATGALTVAGGVGIVGNLNVSGTITGISNVIANTANFATSAGTAATVTSNAQANITSVGTLTSLSVNGNINASGTVSATGGIITLGTISSTDGLGNNLPLNGFDIDGTGNISIVGTITANSFTVTGSATNAGLAIVTPNYISTGTANLTITLSNTTSTNILINTGTGNTIINQPTGPVDGQVFAVTVCGNTASNISVGTGTFNPTFAGTYALGDGFKYVYRNSNSTWYATI